MLRRVALATALAATFLASPVQARTLNGIVRPHLAAVYYEPCPAYLPRRLGCAYQDTATVYVPPGFGRVGWQHELGHLYDAQYLDDHEREVLMKVFHAAPPWSRPSEYGSPGELFADAYAACRLGRRIDGHSGYGYDRKAPGHPWVCALIRLFGP